MVKADAKVLQSPEEVPKGEGDKAGDEVNDEEDLDNQDEDAEGGDEPTGKGQGW